MFVKKFLVLAFLLASILHASSQMNKPGWSIGVNPFSLFEPLSNLGPCAEIRVSPAVGCWAEASYILRSQYQLNDWKQVRGARILLQPRFYFSKRREFFIAPEFRLKWFNYSVGLDFVNDQTRDTLMNYFHRATQVQIGGGLVMGIRGWLSRRHQLMVELTGGLGAKNRQIIRHDIPAGYQFVYNWRGFGLTPHYELDNDVAVFIPGSIRLIWKLNRGGRD
jgi:hypothetical protein